MRLYVFSDCVAASRAKHGCSVAALERKKKQAAEKRAAAKKAKLERRGPQIDALVAKQGVVLDFVFEYVPSAKASVYNGSMAIASAAQQLKIFFDRITALRRAMQALDPELDIREDSEISQDYLLRGQGDPRLIAEIQHEMGFLYAKTDYDYLRRQYVQDQLESARDAGVWLDKEEMDDLHADAREDAKRSAVQNWLSKNDPASGGFPQSLLRYKRN
jgi:hypothetical protein